MNHKRYLVFIVIAVIVCYFLQHIHHYNIHDLSDKPIYIISNLVSYERKQFHFLNSICLHTDTHTDFNVVSTVRSADQLISSSTSKELTSPLITHVLVTKYGECQKHIYKWKHIHKTYIQNIYTSVSEMCTTLWSVLLKQ